MKSNSTCSVVCAQSFDHQGLFNPGKVIPEVEEAS